jgi:hypothetical protein
MLVVAFRLRQHRFGLRPAFGKCEHWFLGHLGTETSEGPGRESVQHSTDAIRTLAQIMKQPEAPYAARVAAAEALLDRGWGKPRQSHEAEMTHSYVIEIPLLMDNGRKIATASGKPYSASAVQAMLG